MAPHNDVDCRPLDYFRVGHAETTALAYYEYLKYKSPIPVPLAMVRRFMLAETDKMIADKLAETSPNPKIHQLLTDETLSYRQQNQLLKGLEINAYDILWLNKEAQDLGYLLDVYHEEKHPVKFDAKKHPYIIKENEDGSVETIGVTDMTEGEMKALLQQRKVVQARIYHKDTTWHCFYFTFKGLAGEESGVMGSKPHYHYLSDKSGIAWNDLMQRIKACDMPTSKVHIVVIR